MKTSERHHLKDNELAIALGHANEWAGENQRTLTIAVAVVLAVAAAVGGYFFWQNRVDAQARTMLADAMVVADARVMPPQPPIAPATSGNVTPPAPGPAVQPPGTYPTEQAKLEAALPKLVAAADAFPKTSSGLTARFQAAATLVELKRYDEAIAQYDRVAADGSGLLAQTAQLGKAEAQVRAARYDQAIAGFQQLSNRTDLNVPKEAMLLELARAYRLAGKTEDAKKTLTQIVEQHADSPFVTEAKQELDKLQG